MCLKYAVISDLTGCTVANSCQGQRQYSFRCQGSCGEKHCESRNSYILARGFSIPVLGTCTLKLLNYYVGMAQTLAHSVAVLLYSALCSRAHAAQKLCLTLYSEICMLLKGGVHLSVA